ncbi:MAG: chemotaxis protein CheX [Chitinispirillia bacterium]|nr:chemotaxis protein CheX [Chitinispirillia bacterium]MCL2242674.1 chemotaxis protein CheX [Chitinispirillia bacterium]
MSGQNAIILDGVCKMILEELAFLFCESQDASAFDYNQIHDAHKASMLFTGPKNGKCELAAGRNLCLLLASNMLGIEPDEDQAQAEAHADDALKEALNVICGRFLTEAFGEEAVYSLTAPVIGAINDLSLVDENAESETMLFFETEGYCLIVKLTVYK